MISFSKQILFLLLVFIKVCLSDNNVYKIPFGLYNIRNYNNISDIVHNIFFNIMYVNLSIGTPPQNIPFGLNMNSQTFTIYSKVFDKNESSTYEELSKYENNDENEDEGEVSSGYYSKDILNINNISQEINFLLADKLKYENYPFGMIGLLIPNNIESNIELEKYPFFNSLKEAKLINSFTWTLKYFNNISLLDTIYEYGRNNQIIGEFIFGNEPHNYEEDKFKYSKSDLIRINPLSSYYYTWEINFDNIYFLYKNESSNNKTSQKININLGGRTKLIPETGFIFMPKEFNYMIRKRFFEEYYEKNICTIKGINNTIYGYIECDNDTLFKLSSFPDICFEHKEFETTFNFTYKDLFVYDKNRDKYIFLMLSDKYLSGWIFGSIFLKKYQLIFNQDSKTIGYYKSMNYVYEDIKNDNNGNTYNNENNDGIIKYIILIILLVISSILLILIGMYIQNKYCNKKKNIKANELTEESFSYENENNNKNKENFLSENNNENNNNINSINGQQNEDFS